MSSKPWEVQSFALVFLLLSLFVLSIFHTFRNLDGLHVSAVPGVATFAGDKAAICVIVQRHGERTYENIAVHFTGTPKLAADLLHTTEERLNLYVPTFKRGRFSPGRLVIETIFPFGICRAWSLLDLKLSCLVYPKPVACDLDYLLSLQQNSGNTSSIRGNDDFHGLREYRVCDSLQHVAWKTVARGQGMYTKEYATKIDRRIWLRWDMFPDLGTEERLSRLCYCVLQLDTAGLDYGLELPGTSIAPGKGTMQLARMLETLALFAQDGS